MLLDVLLLLAAALFAVSGFRQGLVVGALAFAGFLGGGALGSVLSPYVAARLPRLPEGVVGVAVVLAVAVLGQVLAAAFGVAIRGRLTWRPVRLADSLGGAALSATALLLVAWLLGSAVAVSPLQSLAAQVRASRVLTAVDETVPEQARTWFSSFRRLVGENGPPPVFGGLNPPTAAAVPPPDPSVATLPGVIAARRGVVKVVGVARECNRRLVGSGFVYAAQRVLTNAHVVAGVREPTVEAGGRELKARVVEYDPRRDVAVLVVAGLGVAPLPFAEPAASGDDAVVLGYPLDGPFLATPARVRQVLPARGPDIYQTATVDRQVYALRTTVRPGNSGGPLVTTAGSVLGVVFAAALDDPQTGYALTAEEVSPVAEAGRTATERVGTGGCA